MPPGPRTWSVLPHGPIREFAPDLWWVEGRLNAQNLRVMVVARLLDGRLVVHNAVALDDASMARLDAWGRVDVILIPNRFHRRDAYLFHARYPDARVYAPRGGLGPAGKAAPIAGAWEDAPVGGNVELRTLSGIGEREGVMLVRSADGVTAVFCDTLLNLPPKRGLMGAMLHPTGTLAVPRPTSCVFARDRAALQRDLLAVAAIDGLVRVVPGHGAVVEDRAAERLREAAARLG